MTWSDSLEKPRLSGGAHERAPFYGVASQGATESQLSGFQSFLEARTAEKFRDYEQLHDYSVRMYRTFWHCFVQWSESLDWSGSAEPVCAGERCEQARFFPRLRLNYAGNLLGFAAAPADAPAVTACHADGRRVRLTRGELRERVERLAHALSELGLREGDRVAAVMRNDADAIVIALAVIALGATLSTAAPEMGAEAILDRIAPLAPRLLFAHTAAQPSDAGIPVAVNVAALARALPSLVAVVNIDGGMLPATLAQPLYGLDQLIGRGDAARFVWQRFPFDHPLFIMFSSGTTGKPKCIVHGAGGALLEHLKEHRLHTDLRPGDKMYFHTSCAWMMWNWQLSALASGVELVTYDGPISTVDTLWRLVARERVTVFGTSPGYLRMCESAELSPGRQFDLGALRSILSSGAVLFDAQFEWVRKHVKALPLQSISGGTDILGCFVLGNPDMPVVPGEAQCRSLGLDVQAWKDGARTGGIGELICVNPFPSRPIGFFGDTEGAAFHAAYFAKNPGVWTHGDLIEFSARGTARLHGRSDGILNVRGINVGPGEIYRVLSNLPEIREAIVVEQRARRLPAANEQTDPSDQRIVLLLVLQQGVPLTGELAARIRRELARRASAAAVPDRIIAVDALPVTHSGKLSDAAARDAINGLPTNNAAALRNPECLDAIRSHPALRPSAGELPPPGESLEDLERHLQGLWERLFELSPISRDDSFFDLGGNSLLAARLLADLQRTTGRAVPIATLLIAPTIARLASVVFDGAMPVSSPALVLVRAGTGAPLFLVHGLSGAVMECWSLAGALRGPRPVYGLQAPGLDGEEPVKGRVEEIAAGYIEQMRTVQPAGPYAIAGYSFGGLVALEIAQQLRRAGEAISLLCLLDTYVDERYLPWRAWMRHRYSYVRGHWHKLCEVSVAQMPRYVKSRLLSGLTNRTPRRLMARRTQPYDGVLPAALQRVYETLQGAMKLYRPMPYSAGPIVYVRAAVGEEGRADPLPLWRHVARNGLVITNVQGDHQQILVAPGVHQVAATLDSALAGP
jgi:acetoacetyl-CoA synthetase